MAPWAFEFPTSWGLALDLYPYRREDVYVGRLYDLSVNAIVEEYGEGTNDRLLVFETLLLEVTRSSY